MALYPIYLISNRGWPNGNLPEADSFHFLESGNLVLGLEDGNMRHLPVSEIVRIEWADVADSEIPNMVLVNVHLTDASWPECLELYISKTGHKELSSLGVTGFPMEPSLAEDSFDNFLGLVKVNGDPWKNWLIETFQKTNA